MDLIQTILITKSVDIPFLDYTPVCMGMLCRKPYRLLIDSADCGLLSVVRECGFQQGLYSDFEKGDSSYF